MRITAAAIMHDGKTYTLPPPARHHTIMLWMHDEHGVKTDGTSEQGFLTDAGKFVRRKQALMIAENAGQLLPSRVIAGLHELYSEDVW